METPLHVVPNKRFHYLDPVRLHITPQSF